MQQKDLAAVIDEWTDAIADLAREATDAERKRLTKATGDLLEAFASTATNLASHAVVNVLLKLQAQDARLDALEDREREAGV